MNIIKGKLTKPQKVVVYGPEGVGKSTFAAQFPDAVFIDTEDSTVNMDVARFPRPSSWAMLLQQIDYVKSNPNICKTLIIDTADWAERLCSEHICSKSNVKGIEDFGYGKGYIYLEEEFGRFLNKLQDIIEVGINVVITAHAEIKKIEQPEEIGGYDHWQMKLEKKTMPLLKEWSDLLLLANYKVHVVNVDNQGVQKGKNKAQGGKRVMYTTHSPWWDAKNRHNLLDELPFEYKAIEHCISSKNINTAPVQQLVATAPVYKPAPSAQVEEKEPEPPRQELIQPPVKKPVSANIDEKIPRALTDLMESNNVTVDEIKKIVAKRGYYPEDTLIENYDPDFIAGVLVGAWGQVFQMITENRVKNGEFVPANDFMNISNNMDDEMPFN